MEVKVKRLREDASLPVFGNEFAAGADLRAAIDEPKEIKSGETCFVGTGLAMEIPLGYVGLLFARSGLSCKNGLAPANKVGVIDSDYRGEIMVALHNHSDTAKTIEPNDRIAQMIIMPYPTIEYTEADELSDTVRGVGGFGSTGN